MASNPAPDSEPSNWIDHWASGHSLAVATASNVSRYAAMSSVSSLNFCTESRGGAATGRGGLAFCKASIQRCCCSAANLHSSSRC